MSYSDTEQIKKLVADLDAAVSREGARVRLSQYGGGPDESKVVANETGYLRLGIEFLRAAFAPPSPKSQEMLDTDLSYLLTDDSDIHFDWFERREDLPASTQSEGKSGKFVPAIILLVLFSGLVFALVGLVTVISWMTR